MNWKKALAVTWREALRNPQITQFFWCTDEVVWFVFVENRKQHRHLLHNFGIISELPDFDLSLLQNKYQYPQFDLTSKAMQKILIQMFLNELQAYENYFDGIKNWYLAYSGSLWRIP